VYVGVRLTDGHGLYVLVAGQRGNPGSAQNMLSWIASTGLQLGEAL
jgi:hypothetical protein